MSLIRKFFESAKKYKSGPTPEELELESIRCLIRQRLNDLEEVFVKKSEYLENKIDQKVALAIKNGISNKKVALQALRRKRRLEKYLMQYDGALSIIEFQRQALDDASTNLETLKRMDSQVSKNARANLSADKINNRECTFEEPDVTCGGDNETFSNPPTFDPDLATELLEELEELLQTDAERQQKLLTQKSEVKEWLPTDENRHQDLLTQESDNPPSLPATDSQPGGGHLVLVLPVILLAIVLFWWQQSR